MEVSIIITTYNRKELLSKTIHSILSQTYRDFELIIVDHSDYNFFDLVNSFNDNRIKGYQNENNGIISVNRNFGISKASGRYLAFCDDDDTWEISKLEKQMRIAKSNSPNDNILIYTDAFLRRGENKVLFESKNIRSKHSVFQSTIFFSSILLTNSDNLHFNETKLLRGTEDLDFLVKCFENGYHFIRLDIPLIDYRIDEFSVSRIASYNSYLRTIIVILFSLLRNEDSFFNCIKYSFYVIYLLLLFLFKKLFKR